MANRNGFLKLLSLSSRDSISQSMGEIPTKDMEYSMLIYANKLGSKEKASTLGRFATSNPPS